MEKIELVYNTIKEFVSKGELDKIPSGMNFPIEIPDILIPKMSSTRYGERLKEQAGFCQSEWLRLFDCKYDNDTPRRIFVVKLQYYYALVEYLNKGIPLTPRMVKRISDVYRAQGIDEMKRALKDTIWIFYEEVITEKIMNDRLDNLIKDHQQTEPRVARSRENIFKGMDSANIWRIYSGGTDDDKSRYRRMLRQINLNIREIQKNESKDNSKTNKTSSSNTNERGSDNKRKNRHRDRKNIKDGNSRVPTKRNKKSRRKG